MSINLSQAQQCSQIFCGADRSRRMINEAEVCLHVSYNSRCRIVFCVMIANLVFVLRKMNFAVSFKSESHHPQRMSAIACFRTSPRRAMSAVQRPDLLAAAFRYLSGTNKLASTRSLDNNCFQTQTAVPLNIHLLNKYYKAYHTRSGSSVQKNDSVHVYMCNISQWRCQSSILIPIPCDTIRLGRISCSTDSISTGMQLIRPQTTSSRQRHGNLDLENAALFPEKYLIEVRYRNIF